MERKFKLGEYVLINMPLDETWYVHQYFGEDKDKVYILGGYLPKSGIKILTYNGNENLIGTDKIPWNPEIGKLVAMRVYKGSNWCVMVYCGMADGRFLGCPPEEYYDKDTLSDTYEYCKKYNYCEPLDKHFKL